MIATVFLLVSFGFAVLAFAERGWGWLWLWPAVSFGLVASAYWRNAPRLLGKRGDGGRASVMWLLLIWYWLYVLVSLQLYKLRTREAPWHAVGNDVYIGRQPSAREVSAREVLGERERGEKESGNAAREHDDAVVAEAKATGAGNATLPDVDHFVDLTAEFVDPAMLRARRGYRCFPILDWGVPNAAALRALVDKLDGRAYLHCAQGHGRSGIVALTLLARRGAINSFDEGYARLRAIRPGTYLIPLQRKFARTIVEEIVRGDHESHSTA